MSCFRQVPSPRNVVPGRRELGALRPSRAAVRGRLLSVVPAVPWNDLRGSRLGFGRVGVVPISPGAVVSQVWEIYRDQFGVLFGTAIVLYALQFVIYLRALSCWPAHGCTHMRPAVRRRSRAPAAMASGN
jgi:hypothetical protein